MLEPTTNAKKKTININKRTNVNRTKISICSSPKKILKKLKKERNHGEFFFFDKWKRGNKHLNNNKKTVVVV